jgi:hypothetical protein
MFLVGGPAYSGTTLLALMLNQANIVCLDEPDFHSVSQCHRSIPILRSMFPNIEFPDHPMRDLTYQEAVQLIEACEKALGSYQLGIKTCDRVFLEYAEVYRRRGVPVIGIFRDIRDVLVRQLPPWVSEESLNRINRIIWKRRNQFDIWLRYEDLISKPDREIARVSAAIGRPLEVKRTWAESDVQLTMLKSERHQLLKEHKLSSSRIGVWKSSGKKFARETHRTARIMGYEKQRHPLLRFIWTDP